MAERVVAVLGYSRRRTGSLHAICAGKAGIAWKRCGSCTNVPSICCTSAEKFLPAMRGKPP